MMDNGFAAKLRRMVSIRRPCHNCPFRIQGAIELNDGRLHDIIAQLTGDDWRSFWCHKIYYHRKRRRQVLCAGAAAYLIKADRPNVAMRLAWALGIIGPDHWQSGMDITRNPFQVNNDD